MLNVELLKSVLLIAISCSIVTTAIVQKIKEGLSSKKFIILISFFVNMIVGPLFALCFGDISIVDALWSGLFSFIGADILYQTFEDKIFKSFTSLNSYVSIPIENRIKGEDE